MIITSIEISRHRLPLEPPFRASWDRRPRDNFEATIVRVKTDAGIEGVGSGDRMLGFESFTDLFVGQDALDRDRHFEVLSNLNFHYSRYWPLDLALWDLAGKAQNQPVWKLLGGREGRLRLYASSGVLRDPSELADSAERFLETGFPAMKIRFHREDWREDIRALETVRARIGDRMDLMVDCNQGWRMPGDTEASWTLKEALPVAKELERLDVFWMEEPLHRSDREGMRQLSQSTEMMIAGGEMARELHDLRDLIHDQCVQVIQPDAALIGGITGLRPLAQMASEQGVLFTPHTWTNGIGLAANLHLCAGTNAGRPFVEYPFDPPEWSLERRDFMMSEPLEPGPDGWIDLGDRPGLGIELDEVMLERTRVTS